MPRGRKKNANNNTNQQTTGVVFRRGARKATNGNGTKSAGPRTQLATNVESKSFNKWKSDYETYKVQTNQPTFAWSQYIQDRMNGTLQTGSTKIDGEAINTVVSAINNLSKPQQIAILGFLATSVELPGYQPVTTITGQQNQ